MKNNQDQKSTKTVKDYQHCDSPHSVKGSVGQKEPTKPYKTNSEH